MTTIDLKYNAPIPDGEFVVRYCRKNTWEMRRDGSVSIRAGAFKSGSNPLNDISVNWLGHFGRDEEKTLNKVCETTSYCGINGSGRFLRLITTDIRKIFVESLGRSLVTKYRPGPNNTNPSHADICPSGDAVFKALALCAKHHGAILEVPDKYK